MRELNQENIVNDKDVRLALTLKTSQLKREQIKNLTYQQVVKTMKEFVWKQKTVRHVHDAINDIMSLQAATVVAYLSYCAIEKGSSMGLDKIEGVMRGDLDE